MANNIFIGSNACIAKADVLFTDTGITALNTEIIFRIEGNRRLSYQPGRLINPITSFENGMGYYFIAKEDMDLSDFLVPPVPEGTTINLENVLLTSEPGDPLNTI